jgi:pyruvate formate lyase activating enzyme
MNIDIKSMNPAFYRKMCKAKLAPVLAACETAKKKCHLEITNLLIPGENDSEQDIRQLVDFVAANLGKDTPVHFSRYFPRYKLAVAPTSHSSLALAYEIAREKLDYVYVGNSNSAWGNNTACPECKAVLVHRSDYNVSVNKDLRLNTFDGTAICPSCSHQTNIRIG